MHLTCTLLVIKAFVTSCLEKIPGLPMQGPGTISMHDKCPRGLVWQAVEVEDGYTAVQSHRGGMLKKACPIDSQPRQCVHIQHQGLAPKGSAKLHS